MCNSAAPTPRASSLSRDALRGRLRALTGDERNVQVDFLLHLSEFDRCRGYLDAGYGSLWTYCLRELRLREGPAARRIAAMRVLRQHAALEAPLRDGRLCMTTVTLIAPLLAEFGVETIVERAANLTKAEVEILVATLRPGHAPRDGVRQLASRCGPPLSVAATRLASPRPEDHASAESGASASASGSPFADAATVSRLLGHPAASPSGTSVARATALTPGASSGAPALGASARGETSPHDRTAVLGPSPGDEQRMSPASSYDLGAGRPSSYDLGGGLLPPGSSMPVPGGMRPPEQNERRAAELRPVTADQWSLRVTMDAHMKDDLEMLRSLLSHTAGGDLTAIVREALRCAVEKHGKRRGAIAPTRPAASAPSRASTVTPPRAPTVTPSREPTVTPSRAPTVTPSREPTIGPRGVSPATPARSASEPSRAPSEGPERPASNRSQAESRSSPPAALDLERPAPAARAIPAAVRREVWARDRGCCSWKSKDGRRCGSRWKLELDHITPVAYGGDSTADNIRLVCRAHNVRHAEKIFGRRHMAQFTRSSGPSG